MTDASITLTPRQQQRIHVLTHLVAGQCTAAFQPQAAAFLVHRNTGRGKPWRLTNEVLPRVQVRSLVATRYADWNDSHIAELLAREHDPFLSRASFRRILRDTGWPAPHPRRPARHRRRRDRVAQVGMLLQIDGSPHAWSGPDQPRCTLLAAIDDATSTVVASVFRTKEDAQGYLLLLREVLRTHSIPEALYHDRLGIFLHDPSTPWSPNIRRDHPRGRTTSHTVTRTSGPRKPAPNYAWRCDRCTAPSDRVSDHFVSSTDNHFRSVRPQAPDKVSERLQ